MEDITGGIPIRDHANARASRLYCILLALIFVVAACARLHLPPWPLADPDTAGYLQPAVSKLAEGVFKHTNGRNCLYPGFLFLILFSTHNCASITFVPWMRVVKRS
jgi:hypothetical protein